MNYPVVIIRVTYGTITQIKSDQVNWQVDKEESNSNNQFKILENKNTIPQIYYWAYTLR